MISPWQSLCSLRDLLSSSRAPKCRDQSPLPTGLRTRDESRVIANGGLEIEYLYYIKGNPMLYLNGNCLFQRCIIVVPSSWKFALIWFKIDTGDENKDDFETECSLSGIYTRFSVVRLVRVQLAIGLFFVERI